MASFTGLSAFPLTPLRDDQVDEPAYAAIIERLAAAGVDSITALGSTGSYAYLSIEERSRVARLAVEHAGSTPVFVGVGALRTSHVLRNVDEAVAAGAQGVLLAPVSYQRLTEDDVFELFAAVCERSSVPVILYDNPGTTHFTFTTELYGRIAQLPGLASIKIPPASTDLEEATTRVRAIRDAVPDGVSIGISGDSAAASALSAGCDVWYSVLGGILPGVALEISRAALSGRVEEALTASDRLAPLWTLNAECGSLRVIAAIAEQLGLAERSCLPLPIRGLDDAQRVRVAEVMDELGVGRRRPS